MAGFGWFFGREVVIFNTGFLFVSLGKDFNSLKEFMFIVRYPILRKILKTGVPIVLIFLIAAPWTYQFERLIFFGCLLAIVIIRNRNPWSNVQLLQNKRNKLIFVWGICLWSFYFLFTGLFKIIHDRKIYKGSLYLALEKDVITFFSDNRVVVLVKVGFTGLENVGGECGGLDSNGNAKIAVRYGHLCIVDN